MYIVSHEILPLYYNEETRIKLKTISQDWTRLSDNLYVIHHSEELARSCPICNKFDKDE